MSRARKKAGPVMEDVWEVRVTLAADCVVPVRVPARNADEARSRAADYTGRSGAALGEPVNLSELGIPRVPVNEPA